MHRKVLGSLGWEGDRLGLDLEDAAWGVLVFSYLHDEELGSSACLFLYKAKDVAQLALSPLFDLREASRVALEGLAYLFFHRVKLHVALDGIVGALRDADEKQPLAVCGHLVVNNLR